MLVDWIFRGVRIKRNVGRVTLILEQSSEFFLRVSCSAVEIPSYSIWVLALGRENETFLSTETYP